MEETIERQAKAINKLNKTIIEGLEREGKLERKIKEFEDIGKNIIDYVDGREDDTFGWKAHNKLKELLK